MSIAKKYEVPVPEDRPDLERMWEFRDEQGNVVGIKERPKIKPIPEPLPKSTRELIIEIAKKLDIPIE